MGQQQTMTVAAAVEKGGGTLLRRIILVLLVTALMAAMMVVSAMPAMAKNLKGPEGGQPIHNTGGAVNSGVVFHQPGGAEVFNHGSK
jgi:hypothetical protein